MKIESLVRPRKVYFIKPVGMDGPIKIGCAASPDNRIRSLETWSPFALEIVAVIDGSMEIERRFHAEFRHLHERREWFRAGPEIIAAIASINAGTFDVSTLPEPLCVSNYMGGVGVKRPAWFGKQMSYVLRVGHMLTRTGFACPVDTTGIVKNNDTAAIEAVERYLAEPSKYGVKHNWPRSRAKRAEYLASLAA